jgi:hypothetical protein
MKPCLCTLFMIFPFLLYSLIENAFIDWEANRKLKWEDFKAAPDKNSPNAAETSSAIKFDYSYNGSELKYHISCQFDKNKSWGRVKTDYILSHEQGHFDITEIFARKLNKSLKEYKVGKLSDLTKDVNRMYENSMQQLHKMQTEYDSDTNNSINKTRQEEWINKIESELKVLETYAGYR